MSTVNDRPTQGPGTAQTARRGLGSWRTTAAAGFLGLVLVGGLVIALSGGGQDNDPGAPPPAAAAAADPDPAAALAGEAVPAAASAAELGEVRWELVSGRAVPSSPTAGPGKVEGPVHAGFARTPEGAVLAALNIYTRCAFTPRAGWLEVTKAQVEPGKGREVFIKARKGVTDWTAPPGGWGQTAGYRISTYTKDRAVIKEAIRFDSGTLKVQSLTVVWRGGDWRLVLQPDGSSGPYVAELSGLSGFTAFSGGV